MRLPAPITTAPPRSHPENRADPLWETRNSARGRRSSANAEQIDHEDERLTGADRPAGAALAVA